jgi:outer membrane lipoprotein LolB
MSISVRFFLLIFSLFLLVGCSTGIYREGGDEHGYWHLDGKLGIRSKQGADSVSLNWKQCGNRYQIRLNSLIGTHIASIDGEPRGVTAQFSDREPLQADSAEALIEAELGWNLPVGALQHWLRGKADPTLSQQIQRNGDSTIKSLSQGEWQVDYLRYSAEKSNAEKISVAENTQKTGEKLPEKLRLKRSDSTLTLIISNWRLGVAPASCLGS